MTVALLLQDLESRGFRFRVDGDAVIPSHLSGARLSEGERAALREGKQELIEILSRPKPFINPQGDLVIPFRSDPKYHYWDGGQSVWKTLEEIRAPAEATERYLPRDTVGSYYVDPR